jgi:raffinose/stachyose/melibiose transport system permease protein
MLVHGKDNTAINKKHKLKLGSVREFTMFTLPAVIAIILFVELPFFLSIIYSFTKWNGIDKAAKFIGLENYKELLTTDKNMGSALIFTILFTICMVVATNIIALLLALLLDSDIMGKNIFRAAFYIPNIVSLIVIGYVWRFIFSKGFDSLYEMTHLGIFMISWLGDAKYAFFSIIMVSVWQSVGFYLVIYIAGLQTVPKDVVEATYIDGAGPVRRFFSVILPLIMPSITVCVFYSLSNAMKTFDVIFSLTYGGPGTSTTSIALDIYKTAFSENRFGYATAKSVVLFVLILVITVLQVTLFKSKEVEV